MELINIQCVAHSYFLSLDMQMFVVGLVTMYILSRSRKLEVVFAALVIACGWLSFYLDTYHNPPPLVLLEKNLDMLGIFDFLK